MAVADLVKTTLGPKGMVNFFKIFKNIYDTEFSQIPKFSKISKKQAKNH